MQKWDYLALWVSWTSCKASVKGQGFFGHREEEGYEFDWLATNYGESSRLQDALDEMGNEGYELVAAGAANKGDGTLGHWLYFKRPKA